MFNFVLKNLNSYERDTLMPTTTKGRNNIKEITCFKSMTIRETYRFLCITWFLTDNEGSCEFPNYSALECSRSRWLVGDEGFHNI